jgi:IclR family transcriptional regulator, acetate operon repressor
MARVGGGSAAADDGASTVVVRAGARARIQSVGRALALLDAIAGSPRGLSARELIRDVGIGRGTTYHLLQSMVAMGYVRVGSDHRYRVGLAAVPLIGAFQRQVIEDAALPCAQSLATRTGETVAVVARRDADLMMLCSVPGNHRKNAPSTPVGPIHQAHARGCGKLLLALAPTDVRQRYLAVYPLTRVTHRTITDHRHLFTEFKRIRRQGYASDEEEYREGVCSLAAPLGPAVAPYALVVSVPKRRYEKHREEYLRTLLAVAASP